VRLLARVLAILVLCAAGLFCVFGFLAAGELSDPARRLPWRVGYGMIGLGCAVGAGLLLRGGGDVDPE
jgi:hypothetical protein